MNCVYFQNSMYTKNITILTLKELNIKKNMETKGFFKFKIIINVLVSSF